ncbi:FecR family protein [Saccharicrinis sp. 156]|uniref:FecR family protein n=1 Tax=Saccharicrinis sp. 156 TaxID=3417574 RepID=UPI003D345ACA
MNNHQLENIITKSLAGTLNAEEQELLNHWISESKENEKEFKAYALLWEKSQKLVLSDSIDVESSLTETKKRIAKLSPKKRWQTYLRQAAAILLLSLSFSFLYNYCVLEIDSEEVVMQEVKPAFGTHTKLQLADGTTVWLNSGSTLRFPTSFANLDERKVELNGEGYFDVAKNDAKPFIVKTPKLGVKVYGTSFNVSAYKEYNTMTVALEEGKVALVNEYSSGPKELMTMKPNDIVEYDSEKNKLFHSSNSNLKKYTSWKDGYIVFYDDHINDVVQRLEKWYNVKIEIQDQALQDYSFTATFTDETLEQVLNLLSLSSPMSYKIVSAQKQEDNSFSPRKATLSIKK